MSDTGPVSRLARGSDEEEFVSLVLRYLDGSTSPQDLSELKDALTRRREYRALYVRICRLHGGLGELLAPLKAGASSAVEAPPSAAAGAGPPDAGTADDTLPLPERRDAPAAVATQGPEQGPQAPVGPETATPPKDETVEFIDDVGDETRF